MNALDSLPPAPFENADSLHPGRAVEYTLYRSDSDGRILDAPQDNEPLRLRHEHCDEIRETTHEMDKDFFVGAHTAAHGQNGRSENYRPNGAFRDGSTITSGLVLSSQSGGVGAIYIAVAKYIAAIGGDAIQALTLAASAIRRSLDKLQDVSSDTVPVRIYFSQRCSDRFTAHIFIVMLCDVLEPRDQQEGERAYKETLGTQKTRVAKQSSFAFIFSGGSGVHELHTADKNSQARRPKPSRRCVWTSIFSLWTGDQRREVLDKVSRA